MRPPSEIKWEDVWDSLVKDFGLDPSSKAKYDALSKEEQMKGLETMHLCRAFENACNQAYMQGKIRGFMHLDNGQVGRWYLPSLMGDIHLLVGVNSISFESTALP